MDVLIIPEARREIEALAAFRPEAGAWGTVIGHRRGSRFIVEKVLAGGSPGTAPDERLLAGLDKIWPGRVIGIAVVRPGADFIAAVLGPAWFGKVILRWSGPARAPAIRPAVVAFERKFYLAPVALAPALEE